ncbi:MAG: sugar phosphate nucleotidyltransferase, partial [Candidatus Zixiibacteriota bacterium]
MKGIILAGGFGTRLRPLTINIPKPMVPIANVPMMEHVIALLVKHGITDVTALLHFQGDIIKDHFGDGRAFGINLWYVQPDGDFGTAGSVRYAMDASEKPVLVISGDLITDFDLTEAIRWHRRKKSAATILLTRMESPMAYGIVIADKDGRIVRFLEKPSLGEAFSDTINTGIYILEPRAVGQIPPQTNFDFSQHLFPLMLSKKLPLYGKVMKGYWRDVGNINEYKHAHVDFFEGKLGLPMKGSRTERDDCLCYMGSNVYLGEDVKLTGTVVFGNDVYIDSAAKLHNCVVGDRTHVGRGCE